MATALRLADTEGFDSVTMRRVASELGLGAMSLYWYVENRDELLDLMFDEIIGQQLLPAPLPEHWRDALSAIAHALRDVHTRHPWLAARIGARPGIGPNSLRHIEQSLAAVESLHPDATVQMSVLNAVDDFVIGHMWRQHANDLLEEELGESPEESIEVLRPYLQELTADGDFPRLSKLLHERLDTLLAEDHFEAGLQFLLDGIAAQYDPPAKPSAARAAKEAPTRKKR